MEVKKNDEVNIDEIKENVLLVFCPWKKGGMSDIEIEERYGIGFSKSFLSTRLRCEFDSIINKKLNFFPIRKKTKLSGIFFHLRFLSEISNTFSNHLPKYQPSQTVYILAPKFDNQQDLKQLIKDILTIEHKYNYQIVLILDESILQMVNQEIKNT
jgi:hypothetical protein